MSRCSAVGSKSGLERGPIRPHNAGMNLNWKRPLFYLLLPILVFLAFVGFPPPFAPPHATKPGQELSEPADSRHDRA
jgi:hypothetical protein